MVEAGTAFVSAGLAWHFGPSWELLAALPFFWCLICILFIDLHHQLIPDALSFPLIGFGLVVNGFGLFTGILDAAIGGAAGYALFWCIYWGVRLATGKEGMGYGDFKLFAMLGAWLGWQVLPVIILLSSLVGMAVGIGLIVLRGRDRSIPIPFGPYLAAAGWIALLWGEEITRAYLVYSGLQ